MRPALSMELIVTQWDVNSEIVSKGKNTCDELIVTQWDVNVSVIYVFRYSV